MADIKPTGQSSSVDVEDSSSLKGSVIDTSAVDVAAQYANQLAGEDAYTREEEVKLRWKLDFRLVPLLWFNITLAAMDKVTTAMAALYGLKEDTGLTGNRYSWVGSVFYVRQSSFAESYLSIARHSTEIPLSTNLYESC